MGLLNSEFNKGLRDDLLKRNLYAPNSPYEINNPEIVKVINTIADVVAPGNAFDITSTLIGRSLQIGPQTPIVQIGTRELAKQVARTIALNSVREVLPDVNLMNLFDGDPSTKLLTKKDDYQITAVAGQTKLGRFLQEITGVQPMSTPFNKSTKNTDVVRNTGSGQLKILVSNLNRNLYRPSDSGLLDALNEKGISFKDVSGLFGTKVYFSETSGQFSNAMSVNEQLRVDQTEYKRSLQDQEDANEYSARLERVKDLGISSTPKTVEDITIDGQSFNLIANTKYGFDGDFYMSEEGVTASETQIVWGRDSLLGNTGNKFGVRTGLLHRTDALLQAKGNAGFFDRTIKQFRNTRTEQTHFNGSPFRQHTATDQYATYRKAIRYNGNQIYGGNPNSVIYNRVIPKFHPVMNGKDVDNKNLMFSIENLAYLINSNGDTGVKIGSKKIKNAEGEEVETPVTLKLPLSEVGPNGGRLMWFMPYDVRIDESGIARHDPIMLLGRPEPIYSYTNSEKTMTLSFMLLIDYPPQLIGKTHNEIAKFFALGGTAGVISQPKVDDLDKLQKELDNKKKELADISVVKKLNRPEHTKRPSEELSFYWLNDRPKPGNVSIDEEIDNGYEDGTKEASDNQYGGDNGLNSDFEQRLEDIINSIEKENLKYYNIEITGSATKLYNNTKGREQYNLDLSKRRIEAVEKKFNELFLAAFNQAPSDFGMTFVRNALGDKYSSQEGLSASVMYAQNIKPERKTTIRLVPNGTPNEIIVPKTPEENARRNELITEINNLESKINDLKRNTVSHTTFFKERTENDGINRGFKELEASNRKVIPAFHSYTPEDFARRLTFLRQLERPGNSVVTTIDSNGVPLVKNSVFGRPPISILRIGDFIHSKVIIENINYSYETPWDLNPEGMGMQPMIARIDMSLKLVGGQSMETHIDVIQNAESFNHYANSTFFGTADDQSSDIYSYAKREEVDQVKYNTDNLKAKLDRKFNR
jgi:hypothetical protein